MSRKSLGKIIIDSRDAILFLETLVPFIFDAQKLHWFHQIVTISIIHLERKKECCSIGSWEA